MPTVSPDLRVVNSTTYADVAGLQMGLRRLPGEDAPTFLDRLYHAQVALKDHSAQGTLNSIALELGLGIRQGIQISSTDPNATINTSIAGIKLITGATITTIPTFQIQPDSVWQWRTLSALVSDINATVGFSATLLTADGLALQVAPQSNVYTVLGESVQGTQVQLAHAGVIVSGISFNIPVPSFTATVSGAITFSSELPSGCTITYQYRILPYNLVCSDVSIIGLTDPDLPSAAISNGVLAYQIREAIQEIMSKDRSYWAK